MYARTQDRDLATTWATREAQYDAVCTWGIPDHAKLQRLSAIGMPVFVANGDSDPMILPRYSYLLAGLIPHARVKIYPDAAPARVSTPAAANTLLLINITQFPS
jgi:pimeloyl-ACP methyl ester carboxylesterase